MHERENPKHDERSRQQQQQPGAHAASNRKQDPVAPKPELELDLAIDPIEPAGNMKEGFTGQER